MFTVLIAEDEPLIRKGIIYCTDWAKLDCAIPLEASNGEEAAEMIRQHRPDIVLLDVNMPLMELTLRDSVIGDMELDFRRC